MTLTPTATPPDTRGLPLAAVWRGPGDGLVLSPQPRPGLVPGDVLARTSPQRLLAALPLTDIDSAVAAARGGAAPRVAVRMDRGPAPHLAPRR
ncbi:hypothetical protein AB0D49_39250 [Streptomyces sp. NPDC048290]|uniref:hypothetical protein n=1 Tax=Streptomyces sp. NPDC048290 TaxID=3155811 RepID=UPI00343AFEDB